MSDNLPHMDYADLWEPLSELLKKLSAVVSL